MKLVDGNLLTIIVAGVVFSLAGPTKSQTSAAKSDSDKFPIPVYSRRDFIVKFKGEIFSWRNLSHLLRQYNITVPQERDLLTEVLKQKDSKAQSCRGRCFLDERKYYDKTCFCDEACKTFSDCCLDFHSRCRQTGNDVSLENVACGDVNKYSWSGAIMKSFCTSRDRQSTNDCQTVQQLNMTLQKELPVYDFTQNMTYRSIACARCHSKRNLSYWGLNISCAVSSGSIATPVNITAVKTFLNEQRDCSWKYAPRNLNQRYESCVMLDTQCATNQLPVLSVVRQLCSLYSMVFSVNNKLTYRNPHCALCNPDERPLPQNGGGHRPSTPPLSILLDVSANIPKQEEPKSPTPTLITGSSVQGYNLTAEVLNCTSNTTNCTVTFGYYTCENFTSKKNQLTQMRFYLNKSHSIVLISQKQILHEKNTLKLQGNTVYIVCPEQQAGQGGHGGQVDKDPSWHDSAVLIYITFTGTLLSIVSLCFLLSVYLSFKEIRNLPGKCLINLSFALLCYQVVFLGAAKSKEVDTLCIAVAIFVHFFLLAAFSWMSIMAFDTASTFTVKVCDVRRQPSDTRKIFIAYCIVGWGLPAVVVGLCSVLDFTGALSIGYGHSTYCWISNKTAIAVAVVTPVSLALGFNVMCLTKNIYAIRHLQQGASQATNNSSRAPLTLICIKLTAVMGLTWILGLLTNWKQTAFLQYPSTVLNSMQGFFIALCFTTTKKVRGLLKEKFYKTWNGTAEPQTSVARARDQRTGKTDVETGSTTVNTKSFSREQATQDSS